MRLVNRLLAAFALGGLFALLPDGAAPPQRAHVAQLRVREWLLRDDSPLRGWQQADRLPALRVDLRLSPPLTDPEAQARAAAVYERITAEWAAARSASGQAVRVDAAAGELPLLVRVGDRGFAAELPQPAGEAARLALSFPGRLALVPAFVVLALAVLTRAVLPSLLAGCVAGGIACVATSLPNGTPATGALGAVAGGLRHFLADALWRRSLCEDFYLRITLFVVFLFLTIGILGRNGGLEGLVRLLRRRVRGPVSAQLASYGAGLLVFFDDYTNCLLVGSSMRPLCDASRVSRAKLAYIVDSTAAPIAGLSVFSTWVVYEMSQYRAPLTLVTRADGTPYAADDAFLVFLQTLPFRCYCLFALAMVPLVVLLRADFGPMLVAERAARRSDRTDTDNAPGLEAAPARFALVPLLVLVLGTIVGMAVLGWHATRGLSFASTADRVQALLANARSDVALLCASIAACAITCAMTLGARLLSPRAMVLAALQAARPLGVAFGILFLAWSLGHLASDLGTSHYLATIVHGAELAPVLPALLFAVAGGIAFATGTSFGTMAILLPNVVVMAHAVGTNAAFTGSAAAGGPAMMLLCIGAVLEGAIFGDHCSPVSDTSVLSAIGAQCDLVEHVATQLPYALLCAGISLVCGYLPLAYFGPQVWPYCLGSGITAQVVCLKVFGRDAALPPATG